MKKKQVIKLLEDALESATFEKAHFDSTGREAPHVIPAGKLTALIREETDLFRRTWIIGRIEHALKLIKEGKP